MTDLKERVVQWLSNSETQLFLEAQGCIFFTH